MTRWGWVSVERERRGESEDQARHGERGATRLKILLVGHACSPELGSEPGLTWNWAWHLSERHEVWVIAHPQHRKAVEAVVNGDHGRALRVVWADLPRWSDPWDPTRGEGAIHLHYLLWQRIVLEQARKLHKRHRFDILHHVSWGTVNSAPQLWRLGVPFVWGPLGGGQAAPLTFARYLGWRGTFTEAARAVRGHLSPLRPSLRQAATRSAIVLATNRETAAVLHRAGARHVQLFLDNGILPDQITPRHRARRAQDRLELLWAGRVEARKALPLALEAMARSRGLPVRLTIAGDGPLRRACERRAAALGLGNSVRFLGMIPRTSMAEVFAGSDALLFTSLQDGFGSVVIEAMAAGLPVIGLDHQGVGALIPEHAAIKIPVTSPEATARGLGAAIRKLATSPDLGRRMGEAARQHAAAESWSRRAARMNDLYRRCLELSDDDGTRIPQDNRNGALLSKAPT